MGGPRVAYPPHAILVAVEDANLAIDGAGGTAVAVGVEGDGLDEVAVAVLQVEVEGVAVLGRGVDFWGEEARHCELRIFGGDRSGSSKQGGPEGRGRVEEEQRVETSWR